MYCSYYSNNIVLQDESPTFQTGKVLFNLVVDVLTRMLAKSSNRGLVAGLLENFRTGVS
jgi:hypothetical protein